MNFFQAIAKFFRNYVVFKGRSSRSEYWYPILLNILIIFGLPFAATKTSEAHIPGALYIAAGYTVGVIIPSLAVTTRRLHDIGLSGSWQLMMFVPFLNFMLPIMCIIAGDAEDNRFGSNPLSKAADSATS